MMKHTHTLPGTFFIKFTLLLMACFYLAFPAAAQPLNTLRQQAEQGHANAQYSLAEMYYQGDGITRDLEAAFSWYLKAAQQGNAHAQFNVARMYHKGEGIELSLADALSWYLVVSRDFVYSLAALTNINFFTVETTQHNTLGIGQPVFIDEGFLTVRPGFGTQCDNLGKLPTFDMEVRLLNNPE